MGSTSRGSQSASSRYWYDLAGNLSTSIVGHATNCYHYNVQNKLVKIVGTNFVHEFKYNSRSERIAVGTSVNGATMTWRYDACQGPVTLAEFDASAAMTRWYVRGLGVAQGIGDVVAEVDVTGATAKPHYYLSNHRGDTLVVLNPDGADNSAFRYDAFGKCYASSGPFTPRYTFSTQEYLPEAQLYLYQHRLYDVAAGRWTQRDPIDYENSLNLYCFCRNSPLCCFDTNGRIAYWSYNATTRTIHIRIPVLFAGNPSKWAEIKRGIESTWSGTFKSKYGDITVRFWHSLAFGSDLSMTMRRKQLQKN